MRFLFAIFSMLVYSAAFSQNYVNVMFYNLYRFPVQPPMHRENILKEILDSYHPDLFLTCELQSEKGADSILKKALNYNGWKYERAAFVPTQTDMNDPLQQMAFYNKQKLTLIQQQTYLTNVREINHYTFSLNTVADSIYLDAFVTHLKSSEGMANRQLRLEMIDTFVKKLESIPANHYVLLAGDFNFYSSYTEPAYSRILDTTNAVIMVDPIHAPGNWNNNDSFKAIHTQATRLSTDGFGEGGASGGMDDRFDFIMISKNLEQQGDLSFVNGSYKAYGNNGNCFDNRVDAYDCEGPYSLALRQNLYNMSDHIPVVMQLKTNKDFIVGMENVSKQEDVMLLNGNMIHDDLILEGKGIIARTSIRVYNNLGQQMEVNITLQNNIFHLDFRYIKPGMYYLKLAGANPICYKILKI